MTKSRNGSALLLASVCMGAVVASAAPARAAKPAAAGEFAKAPVTIQSPQVLDWTKVHDVGNVAVLVTNWGLVGSKPGSSQPFSSAPSARWPAGSTTDYLWAGGLWIGALKNGEPHVTTAQYEQEFRPGPLEIDRMYETHAGAPGGNRAPSPDADDDHDGRIDEDWLDGRDNDGDGRVDEDFAAISQQMFSCEYNDSDPLIRATNPNHVPLEVLVHQSSFAWTQQSNDDFIGFDLEIINRGFNPLTQVYVGFFADCDIGAAGRENLSIDDRAGFWEGWVPVQTGPESRNVKVSIGYMFDTDGDAHTADGYIGFAFLGTQDPNVHLPAQPVGLRNFRMFSGRATFEQGGDPTNDAERYQVLAGTSPGSLPQPDPATGLRPPQMASRDDDYRILVSVGPFETVDPGDTLSVQMAMVLGPRFEGLVTNAAAAQSLYDGVWLDCDGDPTTGVLGRETPVCGPGHTGEVVRFNLCDSLCDVLPPTDPSCVGTVPPAGCVWVDADCEAERQTGRLTGIEGKECVIHWTTEETVPVTVQDLEAHSGPGGVHLSWRLADAVGVGLRDIQVLRAEDPVGPYAPLSSRGLTPAAVMEFDDGAAEAGHIYWYRLVLRSTGGEETVAASIRVVVDAAGTVATTLSVPVQRDGRQVQIGYRIGTSGPVELAVYDMRGRRVRVLYRGWREAGSYTTQWDRSSEDGARLARGIYLVRLEASGQRLARKLLLARE